MGSRAGSWWCRDRCQNHKMACLPEGRSSHKHLRERRPHTVYSMSAERKTTGLSWNLPPALSLSLSPWSLPMVITKAISNNPARETIWKRLSLQRPTAACGPGCWHDARRCRQAARLTSPATETHEQRLRWASAPPWALKLPVRGSFALRQGSDSSINQTQNHLNDRCVFIVVSNKCDDNSSCVAGVLTGRPEHWLPGQLLPGLPWLSVNCPMEF